MIHDEFPTVSLHNVCETEPAGWADGGHRLLRVPTSVSDRVNVAARERLRHPTGCELRFVPEKDGTGPGEPESIEVTLSAPEPTQVWPFWGDFQPVDPVAVGPTPTTLELRVPDRIRNLDPSVAAACSFATHVCRLAFDRWVPIAVHHVCGPCRPPAAEELPATRYLAYGTSIAEGAKASAPHLGYVSHVSRRLGADAINLGVSGAAYCEPKMAEHIAGREDWDVATLSLSVNMANRGFTREQFARRVDRFVNTVAEENPDRPVVCVTLFPYHADVVCGDDPDRARGFRAALRRTVEENSHENVSLVEGPSLLDPTGLTADLLHPGDDGMAAIGDGLVRVLEGLVGSTTHGVGNTTDAVDRTGRGRD